MSSDGGLEELELNLEELSLDNTASQINDLAMDLEKLEVDKTSQLARRKHIPIQVKVKPFFLPRKVILQLKQLQKTPDSPERQKRILFLLKDFPEIFSVIKNRYVVLANEVGIAPQLCEESLGSTFSDTMAGNTNWYHQSLIFNRASKLTSQDRALDKNTVLKQGIISKPVLQHQLSLTEPSLKCSKSALLQHMLFKEMIATYGYADIWLLYKPFHHPMPIGLNLQVRKCFHRLSSARHAVMRKPLALSSVKRDFQQQFDAPAIHQPMRTLSLCIPRCTDPPEDLSVSKDKSSES